ncbi:MAG: YaaA family protein [Flavobacteriales bacterium]
MKLLLAPTKLMRPYPSTNGAKPVFLKSAKILQQHLKKWSVSDCAKHMKLSTSKAQETQLLIQNWGKKNNTTNASLALYAYVGEAFKALDADSCTAQELSYFEQHLFILSGLYGLLSPFAALELYRLEMAQSHANPDGGSLYAFWRPQIEKYLLRALQKDEVILNLASAEYADVLQDPRLRANMLTPYFYEQKGEQLQSISVFSKQARGTMARWCAKYAIQDPAVLNTFDESGYRFSAEHSTQRNLVFIR